MWVNLVYTGGACCARESADGQRGLGYDAVQNAQACTVGHPLAGLASVQMENDSAIRMHAQGPEAIYVVTLPKLTGMALRTLTSTLQLYQGD